MEKKIKQANMYYYSAYAIAIFTIFAGYFLQIKNIALDEYSTSIISSIAFLYTLISIPVALWLYNKKVKIASGLENDDERVAIVLKWSKIRILLVALALVINILLYFTTPSVASKSFLFAAGIAALAMLFCKPKSIDFEPLEEPDEEQKEGENL